MITDSNFNYPVNKSMSIIGTYKSGKSTFGKKLESQGFKYLDYSSLNENITIPNEFIDSCKLKIEKIIVKNILNIHSNKIVIDGLLEFLNNSLKMKLIEYLKKHNVLYVNITTNMEETLFSDYLVVLNDSKIAIEGNTLSVLREEKILKKLGFNLPFMVDLSIQLGYYNLVDNIYLDKEKLVSNLWN